MHTHSLDRHMHDHVFLGAKHEENERRTWVVVVLTLVMMVGEIAAGSFFLGPVRRIPEPLRIPALRLIPFLVLATIAYWLWRYRRKRVSRDTASVIAPEAI